MYKIFVGNKPIILTTELETEKDFKNYWIDSVDINKVLTKLKKDKYNSIRLVGTDKDVLLKKFLSFLPNVIAGGGKVYNQNNEILFIFRNGKWDLPKGKLEIGESIDACAKREVQEECGLNDLEIVDKLMNTYHTYEHKGQSILKETHWYLMTSSQTDGMSPQIEEGIEKVSWVSKEDVNIHLENTYENIKRVFEKYYSLK